MMAGEKVTWLEGHCLSYGGLPSWPFVEVLQRWLGVELGDPEVVVRTRARARLTPILGAQAAGALPALARLLRIQLKPDVESRSLEPQSAANDVRRGYAAWIEALAAHRPVVLAIEDLHWAHASTRELAEDLLALTDRAPLLLVVTLRRDPASEGWRIPDTRARRVLAPRHRAHPGASARHGREPVARDAAPGGGGGRDARADRRARGGQPALRRGAPAGAAGKRGPRAEAPHLDDNPQAVAPASSRARESPGRAHRSP